MTEQEYMDELHFIAEANNRRDRLMDVCDNYYHDEIEALLDLGFDVVCRCNNGRALDPVMATPLSGKAHDFAASLGPGYVTLHCDTGEVTYS